VRCPRIQRSGAGIQKYFSGLHHYADGSDGHGQLLYGRTYDVMVFGAAGLVYLVVNGLLTLMMRLIERKALAFERRN
jgi:hypothetical protein